MKVFSSPCKDGRNCRDAEISDMMVPSMFSQVHRAEGSLQSDSTR